MGLKIGDYLICKGDIVVDGEVIYKKDQIIMMIGVNFII